MNDLVTMYSKQALVSQFVEFVVVRVCRPSNTNTDQHNDIKIKDIDTK